MAVGGGGAGVAVGVGATTVYVAETTFDCGPKEKEGVRLMPYTRKQ